MNPLARLENKLEEDVVADVGGGRQCIRHEQQGSDEGLLERGMWGKSPSSLARAGILLTKPKSDLCRIIACEHVPRNEVKDLVEWKESDLLQRQYY